MEAVCMLLRRLSYPCRYSDMTPRFGKLALLLSKVTIKVVDTHGWRIKLWNHDLRSPARLRTYGGSPWKLLGICGRMFRPTARPHENRRVVYNGQKRVHALKFQSVAPPNHGYHNNKYRPIGGYYIFNNTKRVL